MYVCTVLNNVHKAARGEKGTLRKAKALEEITWVPKK
jgi:hypothetical protein